MPNPQDALARAVHLHRAGLIDAAVGLLDEILAADPDHAESLHLRGTIAYRRGDHAASLRDLGRAAALASDHPPFLMHLALALGETGRYDEALAHLDRALTLSPGNGDIENSAGNIFSKAGRYDEALACYQRAAAADPENFLFHYNLAIALLKVGKLADAISEYKLSIARKPDFAEAHNNLGEIYRLAGDAPNALDSYQRAIDIDPRHSDAWNNIGIAARDLGWFQRAEEAFGRALEARARSPGCFTNIGNLHRESGRYLAALACYRRALEFQPQLPTAHSNIIFTLFYDPDVGGEQILSEAVNWNDRYASGPMQVAHPNDRDPERRLRVGYVSGDFRRHAVGYFLEPLLAAHDPAVTDVYCYSGVAKEDDVTARIRAASAGWRQIVGMGNAAVTEMIRRDQIDILVDCSAHTGGNRLLVFARKPAPVQVSLGLLGHGGTTGLQAMDYFIADDQICPPGFEAHFSEQLVRLPGFFAPFLPDPSWPEPFPLPPAEAPVVFGCVAEPARIGREVFALWKGILERLPQARVLLKNKAFNDDETREEWQGRVRRELGDRVDVEALPGGWANNMDIYGRLSVILDTFPASGATTVLIPLWMGVPVVTRAGCHSGQRFGASILSHLGLSEFIANSAEEWIDIAVAVARDRKRLGEMRTALRPRIQEAPMCDARGVARSYENAYREMWRRWCARPGVV